MVAATQCSVAELLHNLAVRRTIIDLCGYQLTLCVFVCRDYVHFWAQREVEVVAWTVNTQVEKLYYQELLKVNYITDSLLEDCQPHY